MPYVCWGSTVPLYIRKMAGMNSYSDFKYAVSRTAYQDFIWEYFLIFFGETKRWTNGPLWRPKGVGAGGTPAQSAGSKTILWYPPLL